MSKEAWYTPVDALLHDEVFMVHPPIVRDVGGVPVTLYPTWTPEDGVQVHVRSPLLYAPAEMTAASSWLDAIRAELKPPGDLATSALS